MFNLLKVDAKGPPKLKFDRIPKMFGLQHILFIILSFSIIIVALILIKKYVKKEKTICWVGRGIAIALLVFYISNAVSRIFLLPDNTLEHKGDIGGFILETFCSLTAFLLSLTVLIKMEKKDVTFYHFLCYIAVIGGTLATIFCNYLGQKDFPHLRETTFWFLPTITALIYHVIMLFLALYLFVMRRITPTLKKFWILPVGLSCYITYGAFLHFGCGRNLPMNLTSPLLEGTIFTWYFIGSLLLVLGLIVCIIFDAVLIWYPRYKIKSQVNQESLVNTNSSTEESQVS